VRTKVNRRTLTTVAMLAAVLAGGASAVAAVESRRPPSPPAWVDPGTRRVVPERMPALVPIVDRNGKVIGSIPWGKLSTSNPPPGAPPADGMGQQSSQLRERPQPPKRATNLLGD
jgi:hypothetical protein